MLKMKLLLIVGIIASGAISASANEENQRKLVVGAIQEATQKYDEMLRQATINGAQTRHQTKEAIKSTKLTQEIGRIGSIYRSAFNQIQARNEMPTELAMTYLKEQLPEACQFPDLKCNATAKYRSVNGTCNNIDHPYWGATQSPSVRLLKPAYKDGKEEPRGGFSGTDLPPPRKVSLQVHIGDGESFDAHVTHMAAQFGQFLDHDITLTPVDSWSCCANNSHNECWTIAVANDDPFYKDAKITCLDFVRSTEACFPSGGASAHREQFNGITAYIDASGVYGSDENTFRTLRDGTMNGRLAENSEHSGFLPWRSDVIKDGEKGVVIAGDVRANEMPALTVMHSLFLREHNRIAEEFAKLRSDWSDEEIFQETRRIIAAELQQITYGEFLPAMLGPQAMKDYNLELPADPRTYTKYNSSTDATILNVFATAAYRFGHTLVNGLIELYYENKIVSSYHVRDNYLISKQIIENVHNESSTGYDLILNGLIRQKAQAYDGEIHKDMTNHLFKTQNFIGSDLAARNIQRGRDHGTPSYNEFRKYCNIPSLPTTWDSAKPAEISETSWKKLQSAGYKSPHDIDLYTGGLSEIPVSGALSGPTFVCLQAIQFERLWKGDRFFFTHGDVSGSFTPEQLAALRGRTLGDIICQNSAIKEAPRNVFYMESQINPMIPCDSASRKLDVSLFASTDNTSSAYTHLVSFITLLVSFLCSTAAGPVISRLF